MVPMAVERGLLLIADIAGYTRFMDFHRPDLAHAQDVVARLLEPMIDASPSLQLVEVEGDAAFLYPPSAYPAIPELAAPPPPPSPPPPPPVPPPHTNAPSH